MNKFSAKFKESAWHWIRISAGINTEHERILHGCFYRKGYYTSENNAELYKVMNEACKTSKILSICGDFNLPTINWKQPVISNTRSKIAEDFVDILDSFL